MWEIRWDFKVFAKLCKLLQDHIAFCGFVRDGMLCWRVPQGREKRCVCCVRLWHGVRAWYLFNKRVNRHSGLRASHPSEVWWVSAKTILRRHSSQSCPQLCILLVLIVSYSKWFGSLKPRSTGWCICDPFNVFEHLGTPQGLAVAYIVPASYRILRFNITAKTTVLQCK